MKYQTIICLVAIQAFVCTASLPGVGSTIAGAGDVTARWSWQQPQAKVLPTGDLQWTPKAFEFKAGDSIRYIDFDSGNDANDGLLKQTPWKHHPWDPDATGKAKACKGMHTYIFKQGVDYRGLMDANESGTDAAPILLTRDPSWGEGPAVICGSEAVTGWKKGADNPLIPEHQKVWYVDLNWAPRNVWMVGEDSTVTRITLARAPNWKITNPDDIKSEWWTWKNPDKPFDNYATINGQRRHLAFDKEHINTSKPQDYYQGAIVWTTKGWVMGSPFPARVLAVDRENGSLTFPGQWGGGPSYKIIRGCRYYLEDKPQYLDSPGEFWFDKKGEGGRLYIRLPGDQDPNTARVEVAKRIGIIDSRGMSHVHVSGLTFRFTNIYWNLVAAPYWVSHESIDVEPGCIRLLGSGTDIQVTGCTFEHVHKGVRLKAVGRQDAIDKVVVSDNVFSDADSGGVELADGTTYGDVAGPMGRLYDVHVMRNKFDRIGIRPDLFGQGEALEIDYAETAEVAGNIFDRVCAQGIDVHGGKPSGAATDRSFTRILIHHNKAVDTLLNVDDFGGIETWQGGPAYVYDNISGNPGGYRNWDHVLSPDTEDRFGHAYYLDGAFKNYYFNNIAWGKSKGPSGRLANTSAFQEIISYQNTFFNNTIYNFVRGSRRQEPQAGRVKFLGNIWQSMGLRVFRDADPARTANAGNEAEAGPGKDRYAIETNAYSRNIFYDMGDGFGVFEPSGRWLRTLQSFREALESYKPLAATVGVMAEQSPLRDPAAHDFRPSANSAARGLGAKVFVPWSLYETVGEWNFYPIQGDPTHILDEHWCMSPYYTGRDNYYRLPTYPLKGVNITLKDYQNGPLENWTTGALHFNGSDQYAVLSNEDINRTVTISGQRGTEQRTVGGADLSNPQIHTSNFLIEAYFKTAPGQIDATLIQKMDSTGWSLGVNGAGGVTLTAKSGGTAASLASRTAVNDGRWHHVIAEADRKVGTFVIYMDGKQDTDGPGLGADTSLANDADLYVGGTPQGHNLEGAIDFMRIARGTLADAKTTIDELYAWEFNGPFLYDFTGRERPADGGHAGAIDDVALGQVRAATYVVDQAAPGADDSNPGTEDKPFKTVQHAADVAKPGDTIYVMAGKYDERIKVKAGGTEGRPVAFVAKPRRSVIVGGFDLEASYIRMEGFEITADKPVTAVQLRASHCEILDNYIHDMMVAVAGTVGKPSADGNTRDYSAVAHNRIAYNKVYHCEYGFILGGEDWLVENNEVSRLFMYASGNGYDDCDYSRFFGKGCIQRYNYYHGSTRQEIKTAHVDCLQTFTNNGEIAMDLLFEHNTCFDFHQMCMVESTPHLGSVRGWTFRHNIISPNSPTMRGGWGPDIVQTINVTIENCTISTMNWACIGLRGAESTGGLIRNNILCDAQRAVDDRMDFTPANPVMEYNLTFKTAPLEGETNINGKDPLFEDPQKRDFRLKKGSPAIGAGKDGVTVGALEYPNVYYVDPRHPAAGDEPAWGYPAVPLASLAKACAIAQPGETIVLRGGVYREVLAPKNDGVTVHTMKGEKVTISGADLIEGWKREADGSWSVTLAAEPKKLLRDGRPWSEFSYDKAARRIMVKSGGDPRLHVFETVLREHGIDLVGKKDAKIKEITVVDILKAGAANQ
jgi:hypothetical protein